METAKQVVSPEQILVINNGYTYKGISGGDRHVLDMISGWSAIGGSPVQVILPDLGFQVIGDYRKSILPHVLTTSYDRRPLNGTIDYVIAYCLRIIESCFAKLIRPPKIVIAASHLPYDIWPSMILKRRFQTKLMVYVFHLIQEQNRSWSPRNLISRLSEILSLPLIRRYADLVITDNQVVTEQLIHKKFHIDKVVTSNMGIPLATIKQASRSEHDHQLIVLSRLTRNKGVFDLPEILTRITSALPGTKLLIMGEGSDRANLDDSLKDAGLEENVEFAGFVNEKDKYSLLKSSKIFLAPSHEEGWGIGICEAMACNLPVVAYDLPAYRSVFRQGIFTSSLGDTAGFAGHVIRLLEDEELCKRTAHEAYLQAQDYDLDLIIRSQWNALQNLFSS